MKLEATFTLERETKNTYRYQEELSSSGKPPVIGTLYIQKWAVGSPLPRRIKIIVETEGEGKAELSPAG
jgi:hypothetical protein